MKTLHTLSLFVLLANAQLAFAKWHTTVPVNQKEVQFITTKLTVQGEENITLDRTAGSFTAINIDGPVFVNLTQGKEIKVQLNGPAKHIKDVVTEVRNGTLYVSYHGRMYDYGKREYNDKTKLEVNITMPALNKVEMIRASILQTTQTFATDKLQLNLAGASMIKADLDVQTLALESVGASMVTLSGVARQFSGYLGGASVLRAFNLKAEQVAWDQNGASVASIYAGNKLTGTVNGLSTLHYKGSPQTTDLSTDGTSSVTKTN